MGLGVRGLRLPGSGQRVVGIRFRAEGVGCGHRQLSGLEFGVSGFGCEVSGFGLEVSGLRFGVSGFECRAGG